MRRSADWQTIWDDRILELLAREGPTAVGDIVDHPLIRVSKATVSRRCRKLADRGLLEAHGNGVYSVTDNGLAYLEGEYDAADADTLDVTPEEGARRTAESLNDDGN